MTISDAQKQENLMKRQKGEAGLQILMQKNGA